MSPRVHSTPPLSGGVLKQWLSQVMSPRTNSSGAVDVHMNPAADRLGWSRRDFKHRWSGPARAILYDADTSTEAWESRSTGAERHRTISLPCGFARLRSGGTIKGRCKSSCACREDLPTTMEWLSQWRGEHSTCGDVPKPDLRKGSC